MPYKVGKHVLRWYEDPFVGPTTWLMWAAGVGGGVVFGMPVAALMDVNIAMGFVLGFVVAFVLAMPWHGIMVALRIMAWLRFLTQRGQVVDGGEAEPIARSTPRIVRTDGERVVTVIPWREG